MNKASLQDKRARMQAHVWQIPQKHKTQIPLNPLNFSPIDIDCRNGKTNLESQYNMSSSKKVCISQDVCGIKCKYPLTNNLEEIKLY